MTTDQSLAEFPSVKAFQPTLDHMLERIRVAGMKVFATIDHAAGAREVGLSMPPTVVVLYGHAVGGTPVMLAAPQLALDLPLRALLRETVDGRVLLSFHPIAPLLEVSGIAPEPIARLEAAQRVVLGALGT